MTQVAKIELHDRPSDAPNYNEKGDWKAAKIEKFVVVGRGTTEGKPTVDIQFTDEEGNQYIAMITATLLASVVSAASGIYERTQNQEKAN